MSIQFESSGSKNPKRQEIREAREEVLANAKRNHDKAKWREEQAEKRGENTWMLPSLSERIASDEQELKKRSKSQKKEKKKKHKKEKKKSKRDSDSESDKAPTWVESTAGTVQPPTGPAGGDRDKVMGPKMERDSWMSSPLDIIPTISRNEIREQKKREQEEEKKKLITEAGQHTRELNPYWKDGGSGLPEEQKKDAPMSQTKTAGDGGYSWWKKAYDRCVQQADDEGRTLDDVAAERYGSLESLENKLREAEISRYGEPERNRPKRAFMRPGDAGSTSQRQSSDRRSGKDRYERDQERDRDYDRDGDRRKHSDRHDRDGGRDRDRASRFRRPGGDGDSETGQRRKFSFMKPGESDPAPHSSSSSRHDRDRVPAWKKKAAEAPVAEPARSSPGPSRERPPDARRTPPPPEPRRTAPRAVSPPSSADSESDSSESEAEEAAAPVQLLTEQEKNEIGAKLVKAEIMGNAALAAQLKARLDASRGAEKGASKAAVGRGKKERGKRDTGRREDDDDEVLLSRTDRSGMVRPLPQREHPIEPKGGRRKKQKVPTHTRDGERERYFDDDDKFELKDLVEREKMGTAEDSNMMFARLAGRSFEKTDDDHQLDDVFMERASKKQSDSKQEEQDRHMAIQEHKKKDTALGRCRYCFENVAKHLIVAIGSKVYLSLPNHRSITEGHCFIVPMPHVAQATVLDEEVWDEVQAFRRCLTQMFEARDEDCVFMETCMGLHRFPHMAMECVPMPREVGDMAPIYFKKALMDSESEWSQNKKVVELSKKNIRQAVPQGFPYFSVDFGLQGGFAHVIEDEKLFPSYFGREICGGMMDLEPTLWRKPHKDSFEAQRQKVLEFEKMWKPHDWTQSLKTSV